MRKCQICRQKESNYVRKLNISAVPKKYILDPESPCASIIHDFHKIDYTDIYYFLAFPKEYMLTKYPLYACKKCYAMQKKMSPKWTYWVKS